MSDQPTAEELIDAVRMHLETLVIPAVKADRKLYFQTLVAVNVLKIVLREMDSGYDHAVSEWHSLNHVEEKETPPPIRLRDLQDSLSERNTELAKAIREGHYDASEAGLTLLAHLKATTLNHLRIANPKLLETIALEEDQTTS